MRIITKRIKVISMTKEEHETFLRVMAEAAEGRTTHYAEAKLQDGSFLGVNVLTDEEKREQEENDAKHARANGRKREEMFR